MKSIWNYLDEPEGTGPAVGKEFALYGMSIGKFIGASVSDKTALAFEKDGQIMAVPVTITIPDFNLPGPLANPLLKEIIQLN